MTIENFDGMWADIQQRLASGVLVKNWSANRGYTGGEFVIDDVGSTVVFVRSTAADRERRIAKSDFQRIFGYWEDYKRGAIGRAQLREHSHNTTYILSILHWCEGANVSPS